MEVLGLKGSAGAQKLLLLGNQPLAPPLFIQRMGTQLLIEIGSIRYKTAKYYVLYIDAITKLLYV